MGDEYGKGRIIGKILIGLVCLLIIAAVYFIFFSEKIGKKGNNQNNTIEVESITLNKDNINLKVDGADLLVPTITPVEATNKSITWESSNDDVASVNKAGLVRALEPGTATITATTENGKEAKCTVKVVEEAIDATEVKITNAPKSLIVGGTVTLDVKLVPEDSTSEVTWESSDTDIAEVDEDNILSTFAEGKVTITAKTNNGKTASFVLEVKESAANKDKVKVKKIKIMNAGNDLTNKTVTLNKNEAMTLKTSVTPTTATNKAVTWESSDTKVATVSKSGKVTAKAKGTAIIKATAKDGSKVTAQIKVKVTTTSSSGGTVTSIKLAKTKYDICIGDKLEVGVTIEPAKATKNDLTWTIADTKIATVSKGTVTPKKAGTTTLTVTNSTKKITKKATINVYECYDLALFWGESNMVGRAGAYAAEKTTSNKNKLKNVDKDIVDNYKAYSKVTVDIPAKVAYEYKAKSNSLSDISKNPTTFGETMYYDGTKLVSGTKTGVSSIRKSSGTNMIPYFAKEYYEKTKHKLIIVSAAENGAEISKFLPNSSAALYEAMVTKFQMAEKYIEAKGKYYKINNKFYVVYHGLSDATGKLVKSYETDYMKIHKALIKDLKLSFGAMIYVARGDLDTQNNYTKTIRNYQKKMVKNNKDLILGSDYPFTERSAGNKSIWCPDKNAKSLNAAGLSQVGRDVAKAIYSSKKIK